MDKLKSFISENRTSFDVEELPEGHLSRFMTKLDEMEKEAESTTVVNETLRPASKPRYWRWMAVPIAALLAGVLFYIMYDNQQNKDTEMLNACAMHTEMDELQIYYRMQMDELLMRMEDDKRDESNLALAGLLEAGKKIRLTCEQFDAEVAPALPCSEDGIQVVNQQYSNSLNNIQRIYRQWHKLKML